MSLMMTTQLRLFLGSKTPKYLILAVGSSLDSFNKNLGTKAIVFSL